MQLELEPTDILLAIRALEVVVGNTSRHLALVKEGRFSMDENTLQLSTEMYNMRVELIAKLQQSLK